MFRSFNCYMWLVFTREGGCLAGSCVEGVDLPAATGEPALRTTAVTPTMNPGDVLLFDSCTSACAAVPTNP